MTSEAAFSQDTLDDEITRRLCNGAGAANMPRHAKVGAISCPGRSRRSTIRRAALRLYADDGIKSRSLSRGRSAERYRRLKNQPPFRHYLPHRDSRQHQYRQPHCHFSHRKAMGRRQRVVAVLAGQPSDIYRPFGFQSIDGGAPFPGSQSRFR